MVADSVKQLCERLEKAEIRVVEWEESNYMAFNKSKEEMIAFT